MRHPSRCRCAKIRICTGQGHRMYAQRSEATYLTRGRRIFSDRHPPHERRQAVSFELLHGQTPPLFSHYQHPLRDLQLLGCHWPKQNIAVFFQQLLLYTGERKVVMPPPLQEQREKPSAVWRDFLSLQSLTI